MPVADRGNDHSAPDSATRHPGEQRSWPTNIASVPCRCGHSWSGVRSRVRRRPARRADRPEGDVVAARREHRVEHLRGLGEQRGAGRVDHDPAGPDQVERGRQQLTLERHQLVEVPRLLPPARLGPASQRPESRARRVDQHPVEGPGSHGGRVPSYDVISVDAVGAGERVLDELGAVGLGLVGDQPGAAFRGQRRQQRCLAAGTGTQVEPALVPTLERGTRHGDHDQLRPLVLDARTALGDGRHRAGVAPAQPTPYGESGVGSPGSSLAVERPGRATSTTSGAVLSAASSSSSSAARSPRAASSPRDDPARMTVRHREVAGPVRRRVGGDPVDPPGQVVLTDLAQHGVDESRRAGPVRAGPGRPSH